MTIPEPLTGLASTLWIGSLIGCGLGLVLTSMSRQPIHRIAWARIAIVTTTVWALLAVVPFERWESEPPKTLTAVAPAAELAQSTVRAIPIEAAPAAQPPVVISESRELVREEVVSALPVGGPIAQPPAGSDPITALAPTVAELERLRAVAEEARAAAPVATASGTAWWVWFWATGAVAVFAAWCFAGLRLRLFFRRCRLAEPEAQEVLANWSKRARLFAAPSGTTPFCCGFVRPRVVVPVELLEPGHRESLRAVLAHEAAHLRQRDLTTTLVVRLCAIPLWPQPVFWMLARRIRREAERRADDRAAETFGRTAYARQLIELVQSCGRQSPSAALSMCANRSDFFQRMESLMRRETPLQQRVGLPTRILRTASAGALCFAAIALVGRDVSAQDPARMKRIEDRLAKLESRMDSMIQLLERMASQVEANAKPAERRNPAGTASLLQTAGVGDRSLDVLAASQSLIELKNQQQQMRVKLETTRALAKNSYVPEEQVRNEETALQSVQNRIELLENALLRERNAQRALLRQTELESERKKAMVEAALISQLEFMETEARLVRVRTRMEALEDALRLAGLSPQTTPEHTKARADTNAIYKAAQMYRLVKRDWPTLEELTTKDEQGRVFLTTLSKDPWGNDYVIHVRDSGAGAVISFGPDGKRGTEDDIIFPTGGQPEERRGR